MNLLKNVFYPNPRITRLDMVLQLTIAILILFLSLKVNQLVTTNIEASPLYSIIKFISGISLILSLITIPVLMIRRMHDANLSGVLTMFTLLPLVIFKSDNFVNNYGPKPDSKNILIKVFAILALTGVQYIL